jgi:hypothetical protein
LLKWPGIAVRRTAFCQNAYGLGHFHFCIGEKTARDETPHVDGSARR